MEQSRFLIVPAVSSLVTLPSSCQYNCCGFFAVKAVFAAKIVSSLTTLCLGWLSFLSMSLGCSECATITLSQGFTLILCRVCLGFSLYYTFLLASVQFPFFPTLWILTFSCLFWFPVLFFLIRSFLGLDTTLWTRLWRGDSSSAFLGTKGTGFPSSHLLSQVQGRTQVMVWDFLVSEDPWLSEYVHLTER